MAGGNKKRRFVFFCRRPGIRDVVVSGVVMFLLLTATSGFAHRVVVFAWIEGDTVYTRSKFPGGTKVSEGDITVFDDDKRELLKGKTDRQGEFAFPLKVLQHPSALTIELNAGMGHQGYWKLTRQEVCQALGIETGLGQSLDPDPVNREKHSARSEETTTDGQEECKPCPVNEAVLRKIVEETIDRKLSPVMDMLVSIREEMAIGLDDVVSGLGYILGLTGLVAWFYSRKKE